MSDEEKKLIEEIQKGNKIGIYELIRTFKREGIENFITVRRKYIDIMINLIEKQSKEIEDLKAHQIIFTNDYKPIGSKGRKFISEDKIKAKIEPVLKQLDTKMKEEYNKYGNSREYQDIVDAYNFLQSLLEKE